MANTRKIIFPILVVTHLRDSVKANAGATRSKILNHLTVVHYRLEVKLDLVDISMRFPSGFMGVKLLFEIYCWGRNRVRLKFR